MSRKPPPDRAGRWVTGRSGWPRPFLYLLAILAVFAGAPTIQAQTIPLRGGEHAAFTRLVAQLPDGTAWTLQPGNGFADLRITEGTAAFDLSETFRRIPRGRVADVIIRPDGLRILLTCPCPVTAVEDLPGLLVIDVGDPPDLAAQDAAGIRPRQQTLPSPMETTAGRVRPGDEPSAPASAAGRALALQLRDGADRTRPDTRHPSGHSALSMPAPDTTGLRSALSGAMHEAAALGVLELAPDAPALPASADTDPPDTAQIMIGAPPVPIGAPRAAGNCLDPAVLDLPAWGDGRAPALQISAARRKLTGEFDLPDAAAVAALARLYLHLGFGAEARALTRAFPVALPDADVLRMLGHLVDGELPPQPGRLIDQAGCPHPGALWALLSVPEGHRLAELDPDAVVRSFADLPAHLRRHLGPGVVVRLLAAEQHEAARRIRDAMARAHAGADPVPDSALWLADARIALAEGTQGAALQSPAAPELAQTPEALALLIEQRLAQGWQAGADELALADSLTAAYRGTEAGHTLASAHIRALAAEARFTEAFDAAARLARDDPDLARALRAELFIALTEQAEDPDFVTGVFTRRPWADPELPVNARLALGARLGELGFPAHARAVIDHPDLQDLGSAALVRAQAYLAEDNPQAAGRALRGLRGGAADALRDRIADMRPDTGAPAAAPRPQPRPRFAPTSAAGPDPSAAPTGPTADGATAAAAFAATDAGAAPATRAAEDDPEAGLLSRGQLALDSGGELRARIEALLEMPIQAVPSAE